MRLVGRLAPSPTGLLHLGNAWAFFAAWFLCRREHGHLLLRLEDIDPERSRKDYAERLVEDLRWLGLHWDSGYATPTDGTAYMQSARLPIYAQGLARLQAQGLVYPCFCSRDQVRRIVGAPHIDDRGAPYPGTCRELDADTLARYAAAGRKSAMRFRIPDGSAAIFHFEDTIYGSQCMNLADCGGDFAVQRSDGVFAYQWAVSVDDAAMGVTQVVRGRDILPSTPRQLALLRCLAASSLVPEYAHVPLLCDAEGKRLAKRHKSLTLAYMREAGCTAPEILGYIAHILGLISRYTPMSAEHLLESLGSQGLFAQTMPHDACVDVDPIATILAYRR